MNNEVNNNTNNELNVKSNNSSKIMVVVLAILLIGALGFICYDKFINNEKPPVPTPVPTTPTNTTEKNDSLTILNKLELTTENQSIQVGGNTFNVRIPSENKGGLYINNSLVREYGYGVDHVYVTDDFAFFTLHGQFDSAIEYAIDSNGNEIKLQVGNYYIHDIRLDNGLIVGKGMDAVEALDENSNAVEKELVVKYENGVITITSKN